MKKATHRTIIMRGLIIAGIIVLPFGIPIATIYGLYSLLKNKKDKLKQQEGS